MGAKTFAEAAGAGQRIKKIFVSDPSGPAIRNLKKVYATQVTGPANLVFSAADVLAMVAGGPADGSTGYAQGGLGSLTPSVLGDGATVLELAASVTTPFPLIFFIDGYAGTITTNYLTSLTINSTVFLPAAATFGGGGAGASAIWTWSSGFHLISGDAYTITVERS
jgi:hypothetical protein